MFEQSGYAPALICAPLHPQRTSEPRISPSFIDDPPLSCWNIRLHESLDCCRSALRLCTNQIDRLTLRCSDNSQESQSLLWDRFSSPPNSSKFRHVYWKTVGKSWVELVSVLCQFVCYCVYMSCTLCMGDLWRLPVRTIGESGGLKQYLVTRRPDWWNCSRFQVYPAEIRLHDSSIVPEVRWDSVQIKSNTPR